MKEKLLNLDSKKRVTLGKLIPKDTTSLKAKTNKDGSITLIPQSNLQKDEAWIYQNKNFIKNISKGLIDIKKNILTKIDTNFWSENAKELEILSYSNQFLKNLEPIMAKNNFKKVYEIKDILSEIATNKEKNALKLENMKTKTNDTIFMNKTAKINIFWTYKKSEIIIIAMI